MTDNATDDTDAHALVIHVEQSRHPMILQNVHAPAFPDEAVVYSRFGRGAVAADQSGRNVHAAALGEEVEVEKFFLGCEVSRFPGQNYFSSNCSVRRWLGARFPTDQRNSAGGDPERQSKIPRVHNSLPELIRPASGNAIIFLLRQFSPAA